MQSKTKLKTQSKIRSKIRLLFVLALLIPASASARVFNFDDQTFSTYLRGTYGTSNLQRNGYGPGFPSSVNYPDSSPVSQGYSAEFGFAFTSPKFCNVRIGVELLNPAGTTAATGTNAAGTALFKMTEQVYSVIPQGNVEIFLKKFQGSRLYLGLGGGYAVTTIQNSYTMTATGTSTFNLGNYIEEGTGWGVMGQGYLGYEFSAFDSVSMSFDVGYRTLTVSNFTSNRNFTAPYGQINTGNPIINYTGGNRYVDLGGYFAGLNFRFYFH